MLAYAFTQRPVAPSDTPQKPVVRKRAAFGHGQWVRVTQRRVHVARGRTADQPLCPRPEHHVVSALEVGAFQAQYPDRAAFPSKATQQAFM